MKIYFAPMEGVTGYIYRNAHHACYGRVDKYFTPFLSPNQNHRFSSRERNDVLPEHNQGMTVVPQLLTNRAEDFLWAARELKEMGYEEINLNLGCPSGTVVAKGKGAGFLSCPEELDRFLDAVFTVPDMRVSIKTRIGRFGPEEWEELMEIYNHYPLWELIIHPRLQTDYYKNRPNLKIYESALSQSRNPVCYNGDLFTVQDYQAFCARFPQAEAVMLGRGLIADPELAEELETHMPPDLERLKRFHDAVCSGYRQVLSGDRDVLFKMKELWSYLFQRFPDSKDCAKRIRKAQRFREYEAAVEELFTYTNS